MEKDKERDNSGAAGLTMMQIEMSKRGGWRGKEGSKCGGCARSKVERWITLCSFLSIHRETGTNSRGCQEKINVFEYGGLQEKNRFK